MDEIYVQKPFSNSILIISEALDIELLKLVWPINVSISFVEGPEVILTLLVRTECKSEGIIG